MLTEIKLATSFMASVLGITMLLYSTFLLSVIGHVAIGSASQKIPDLRTETIHFSNRVIHMLVRFFNLLLGSKPVTDLKAAPKRRIPKTWTFVRLALMYWVVGTTLGIAFNPGGNDEAASSSEGELWKSGSSLTLLLATHIWIWSSIILDGISFNFSRDNMRRFLSCIDRNDLRSCRTIFLRDLAVAMVCLTLILFISNNTYYLAMSADPSNRLTYRETVFSVETFFADFSQRVASEEASEIQAGSSFPGIIATALSTYIPTAMWLSVALITLVVEGLAITIRAFSGGWSRGIGGIGCILGSCFSKDKEQLWIAVGGSTVGGLTLLIGALSLLQ